MVRNDQAMVVQGRDQRAQAASSRPLISAAMAKAKATEKPTYPMYNMGGCMIRPMSCNSGLRSWPSAGTFGNNRSKGLEVTMMNRKKPTQIMPMTDSTWDTMVAGSLRLKIATASVHPVSISIHNSSEPSWPPQTALNLKYQGSMLLLLLAT